MASGALIASLFLTACSNGTMTGVMATRMDTSELLDIGTGRAFQAEVIGARETTEDMRYSFHAIQ